jgi:predicted TIM-barrel fold metal-dependent hydrolase
MAGLKTLILLFTASVPAVVLGQSISIEEFEPKTLLVVPEHQVPRAKFPVIDVHNHQRANSPERLQQLLKDMDSINVRIMVNLSGGYGENLKRNVDAMKGAAKDRFVVFANINFSDIDAPDYSKRAAEQFAADVKNGAQGLKIFKNFGMDLKDTKGQRIKVDDPRFDELFELCGRLGLPVLIHTAEPKRLFMPMDKYNEGWLELKLYPGRGRSPERYPSWETLIAEQHSLFAKHPNTKFIDAHMGWLGIDLGSLGKLLDRLPNVYTEISAVVEELGRQPRTAQKFFMKYQDRIMFGKDTWRASEYPTYYRILETTDEYFDSDRKYHGMWKMYGLDLPDDVLKKVYYKNALKLIPGLNPAGFPN